MMTRAVSTPALSLLALLLTLVVACGEGELATPAAEPAEDPSATTTRPETDLATANDAVVAETDQLAAQNEAFKASHEQQANAAQQTELLTSYLKRIASAVDQHRAGMAGLPTAIETAGQRHRDWIARFRELQTSAEPSWPTITDVPSYQAAVAQINAFAERIPDDESLRASENALIERLQGLELTRLAGELNGLLSSGAMEEVLGNGSAQVAALRATFVQLDAIISDLGRSRLDHQATLIGYQRVRSDLRADSPQTWHAMAERQLQLSNLSIAENIDELFKRAMNDPVVYGATRQQINTLRNEIGWLSGSVYAPKLALRKVRELEVLLDDIERTLPLLMITEPMRRQIELEILGGRHAVTTYTESIARLTEATLQLYADLRIGRVNIEVQRAGSALSAGCRALADQARVKGTSVEHEQLYKDYLTQCVTR